MQTFYAAEPHLDGTTLYQIGDEREADESQVKHLLDLGVLSTTPVEKKAVGAAETNKADTKTLANKSA